MEEQNNNFIKADIIKDEQNPPDIIYSTDQETIPLFEKILQESLKEKSTK